MELRGRKHVRTMRSMTVYITMGLLFLSPVSAGILNWRQAENTEKSTVIAPTAPAETSATSASASASASGSAAGSASAASVSSATSSVDSRPVLASPTGTNATEATTTAASPTAAASNSTTTDNSTALDSSNDPHFCHVTSTPDNDENPFCSPTGGALLDVNASFTVTWDTSLFAASNNVTIELFNVNNSTTTSGTPTSIELLSTQVNSALGLTYINTTQSMLHGQPNASLTLYLNTTKNGQPVRYSGPLFTLLDKASPAANSSNSDSSSPSSSKKLGEKVGLPVGLVFFLVILAALAFFLFRYRRNRNAGYGAGKSLAQRTNTGSLRGAGAGAGHRRNESFHDEPTSGGGGGAGGGGVELQERNRGLTGEDNWDWGGEPLESPVSPTGNQFRDELARQKTGGR